MITTYKNVDYKTTAALREALKAELSQLEYPYKVNHTLYGEGYLTSVKVPSVGGSLCASLDFPTCSKLVALDVVFAHQLLEMPEILTDILLEAQTVLKEDFVGRQEEKRSLDRAIRDHVEEVSKKVSSEKKAEESYEKRKAKDIRKFEEAAKASRQPISSADEFYYALGWLAKHVGSVRAVLPDYLETAFTDHFGFDAQRRVVDSKKRTVNGNSMQWTFGFTAALPNKDNMPELLLEHLNSSGKQIADTSFIWNLVENYGFKFNKTQDVVAIKECVPAEHIPQFEAGFAS